MPFIPNLGVEPAKVDAYKGDLYFHCRVRSKTLEDYPEYGFVDTENFVLKYNLTTGDRELLRDPDVPLTMNSRGSGGDARPWALANGKVYMYGAYEYRDSDATRGLFEWDGEKWLSIVQGMRSQTVIRDDYGGFGPLYSDRERTRLLVASSFYEKVTGGWRNLGKQVWLEYFPGKEYTYMYSRWEVCDMWTALCVDRILDQLWIRCTVFPKCR